jgi:hypothetical protein
MKIGLSSFGLVVLAGFAANPSYGQQSNQRTAATVATFPPASSAGSPVSHGDSRRGRPDGHRTKPENASSAGHNAAKNSIGAPGSQNEFRGVGLGDGTTPGRAETVAKPLTVSFANRHGSSHGFIGGPAADKGTKIDGTGMRPKH